MLWFERTAGGVIEPRQSGILVILGVTKQRRSYLKVILLVCHTLQSVEWLTIFGLPSHSATELEGAKVITKLACISGAESRPNASKCNYS
jgi:hypothetical protein